jgi:hypothetical protein
MRSREVTDLLRNTLHIGLEGNHDKNFINHLNDKSSRLATGGLTHALRTSTSFGQSALQVVKLVAFENADLKIALVDCDRLTAFPREKSLTENLAQEHEVELIVLKPCLDAVLLGILGDTSELSKRECGSAKNKIQNLLSPRHAKNVTHIAFLEKNFSGRKLSSARGMDLGLDRLLDIFGL